MDIDDTLHALLQTFAKELQNHPENTAATIDEYKWKFICMFAAANNMYNVATTLEHLPVITSMDAKQ